VTCATRRAFATGAFRFPSRETAAAAPCRARRQARAPGAISASPHTSRRPRRGKRNELRITMLDDVADAAFASLRAALPATKDSATRARSHRASDASSRYDLQRSERCRLYALSCSFLLPDDRLERARRRLETTGKGRRVPLNRQQRATTGCGSQVASNLSFPRKPVRICRSVRRRPPIFRPILPT
jgi:hypothetical protein